MVHNNLLLFVSLRHGDLSAIEHHPPHLYECLYRNFFRTKNIVTLLLPVYLSVMNRHPLW